MDLVTTAVGVGKSIGSRICANYIYARLMRTSKHDLGLRAYLNLPAQVLEEVEGHLAEFAIIQRQKYGEAQVRSVERYFKAIVDDGKPDFLFPLLERLFFDPARAKISLEQDLTTFIEKNEYIQVSEISEEILSELGQYIDRKIPLFNRMSDEVQRAISTVEILENSGDTKGSLGSKEISESDIRSYAKYVVSRNESVMLSGFDSFLKSDAYISDLRTSFVSLFLDSTVDADRVSINAETVVDDTRYVCLRGNPGCGKTTLLQWLALQACKESGTIPFLVPLRTLISKHEADFSLINCFRATCVDQDLFLQLGSEWMASCLTNRRCIVMLDGVDEVPFEMRSEFWSFVAKVKEDYPNSKIVVTSRNLFHTHDGEGFFKDPTKMNPNEYRSAQWEWKPPEGFLDFRILGLRRSEIDTFIDRWHSGIQKNRIHPDLVSSLDVMRHQLKQALLPENDTVGLSDLARTPMFCALLCLVNLLNKGRLPNTPKSLYGSAIEILVQSRDEIRGVPIEKKFRQLDKSARKRILGFIAYSMQEASDHNPNYQLEEKIETVQEWIGLFRKNYASDIFVDISDAEIVGFLIERVAVVREPTGGFVDFSHRSFLEYLAAEHFVSFRPRSLISSLCEKDQWHGTIRFLIDSENGSESYNGDVLSEISRFVDRADSDHAVRDFVESIFELLHNIPFDCYEEYVQLIRRMRPISKERAPRYRNVPIRILQNALENSPDSGEWIMLEKAYIYNNHDSDLALEVIEREYCDAKTPDFYMALNEGRRIPLEKQYALLNQISSGWDYLRSGRGFEKLYSDNMVALRDAILQIEDRASSDVLLNEVVICKKTRGVFEPKVFNHIGEVHVDTWDVDFTVSVISHIQKNYKGILIKVNRSLHRFDIDSFKDVYFFED
ncbi:NACHT domain-containing protein [uncultured Tateyamaria sp.]|uniref:NACHT domain-containing protein n=1 Tax=uncultured Tateyamaria sp. TaxID=455651 RepID=UPI00260561D4|nr:NACHT domain-containing protein [uncultured Tateyamaria sp.]